MSGDWAKEYVKAHERERQEKQRKEQDAQECRRLAKVGAREKFHAIRERVKRDIKTLRGSVTFQAVGLEESPEDKFTVTHRESPWVELSVDLQEAIVIRCEYTFSPKAGSQETRAKRQPKTLRICSDLDGHVTVHENGEGRVLAEDAEISKSLLKPLLDYIAE
jgi:hypothetical protein